MFKTKCHCGNIQIEIQNTPKTITSCNCTLCHRLGALWAYFTKDEVTIKSEISPSEYQWDKKLRTYHSCSKCRCTTHYTQGSRVAVNTRMTNSKVIEQIPVKFYDGADTFKYVS